MAEILTIDRIANYRYWLLIVPLIHLDKLAATLQYRVSVTAHSYSRHVRFRITELTRLACVIDWTLWTALYTFICAYSCVL